MPRLHGQSSRFLENAVGSQPLTNLAAHPILVHSNQQWVQNISHWLHASGPSHGSTPSSAVAVLVAAAAPAREVPDVNHLLAREAVLADEELPHSAIDPPAPAPTAA